MYDLIRNTATVGAQYDNFKPWWQFWNTQERPLIMVYGTAVRVTEERSEWITARKCSESALCSLLVRCNGAPLGNGL